MNTFYRHIQPNIIKFSDHELIPESLRCHYAINYNVWGIDYFFENYLLTESSDGIFLSLETNNMFGILLENSLNETTVIDIPRLYIMITDNFMSDQSKFQEFILKSAKDNEIYSTGIEGFRPGVDYYLNSTLFNYLMNTNLIIADEDFDYSTIKLPDYIDDKGKLTVYFEDLSNEFIKDYTNLDFFNNRNKLLENTYSEEELNNFFQTFAQIILNYTTIKDHPEIANKAKNQIYDIVLNYFAKGKVDEASIILSTIMNGQYTFTTMPTLDPQNCGCTTGTSTSFNSPCIDQYQQAMLLYAQQMFGDPEFYEDWFMIQLTENEYVPNELLIEALQLFLKEFMALDYNLDFSSVSQRFCGCGNNANLTNSPAEYKKLNDFLKILDYVLNCKIDENTNKIKIYGEAFGELFPKLQF